MSFNKKFFTTGGIVAASGVCKTDTTDIFGDGNGVALYSLDYDASTAQDAATDYSGTPIGGTNFGVGGKINYGVKFDGISGQGITFTNPIPLTNTDFNVSFWVKFDTVPSGTAQSFAGTIFGNDAGNYGAFQIYYYYRSTGVTMMLQRTVGTTVYYDTNYKTAIGINVTNDTWHHISVNYTASTYNAAFYLDGSSAGSATLDASVAITNSTTTTIASGYGSSPYFNGYIDQVRIFNRTLDETTDSEISTLYAEEACVYTATTTKNYYPLADGSSDAVAYYKLDNSAEDSVSTNDGTESNIEYRFGKYGQAAVFNGTNSVLDTNVTISGTADYSCSLWVNIEDDSTRNALISLYTGTGNNSTVLYAPLSTASNPDEWYFSSENTDVFYGPNIKYGQWQHVVLTYDHSITTFTLYIDSVSVGTSVAGSAIGQDLIIGALNTSGSTSTKGLIDQVRVYSTALTSDQVTELYNEKPETDTSNFKTVLYEGNGDTTNPTYISNVGIDLETNGGLVWVKSRTTTYNHLLMDSVRGTTSLTSNDTTAESFNNNRFQSYEANGFMILANNAADLYKINRVGHDFVAWVWKGGGDAVTLTNTGNINSDVSVNNEAGFSIVKASYGSGDFTKTVKHGLTTPPEIIISKSLNVSTQDWFVWAPTLIGASKNLRLNDTDSISTNADDPNFTINSDGTFQTGFSGGAYDIIAYCFHSVSGYSKIGTYEGNGTTLTTTITTGFEPSWVMIKRTDSANNWVIFDNKRDTTSPLSKILYADTNDYDAEGGTTTSITISSTGFSMSTSQYGGSINTDGGQYLYMAFK